MPPARPALPPRALPPRAPTSRSFAFAFAFALALTTATVGCKRSYGVGDHVLVTWEGNDYPALIKEVQGPGKFKVHFDGYDDVWDDNNVARDRIKGRVEGPVKQPEPPEKVRAKALQAARTNQYKMGDHVRVEWHGQLYSATIDGIVGQERYRIRYEGYGPEWNETVGLSRIQPK